MAKTKRAQILLEPEDYRRLEAIALARGVSVGELVRRAVREAYLDPQADRARAVDEILALEIPLGDLGDWETLEREIEDAHDAGLR